MLAIAISTGVVAFAALLILAVLAARSQLAAGPPLSGRTIVIHTRKPDDLTLRGILHAQHADRWTLRDAVVVTAAGDRPAGGLQHVPVANISWAQEIELPPPA
jgi:hypothetical protein